MLHGIAGEVGRIAAETTEANPYAVAAGYLTFVSAMIGRDVYLPVGNVWHHAWLYTLHVGRSGCGRKQEALALTRRIEKAIRKKHESLLGQVHSGGLSSKEGLACLIHDGYTEGKRDIPPVHDERLWVIESEFANVLHQSKRDGNTLSSGLRDAWDGIDIKPATKSNRIWATDPHIAISAAITPSELLSLIESRELSNGFASRFLIVWSERERLVPFPAPTPQEIIEDLARRTAEVIRFSKANYPHETDTRRASLAPSAARLYGDLYRKELSQPDESELLTGLLERRATYVLRLALVLALTDMTLTIGRQHIEAALAWVRYWVQSARFVFSPMAGIAEAQERNELGDQILAYLNEHGEADRRALIHDCFARHVSAARLDEALTALLSEMPPRIELESRPRRDGQPGKGRSVYRLVSSAKGDHSEHSEHSSRTRANQRSQASDHSDHRQSRQRSQRSQARDHSESIAGQLSSQKSLRSPIGNKREPGEDDDLGEREAPP